MGVFTVGRKIYTFNKKNFVKNFLFVLLVVYVFFVLAEQQSYINSNREKLSSINIEIDDKIAEIETLKRKLEMINTKEYKEKIVRERGLLVYPSEIVFIDPLE